MNEMLKSFINEVGINCVNAFNDTFFGVVYPTEKRIEDVLREKAIISKTNFEGEALLFVNDIGIVIQKNIDKSFDDDLKFLAIPLERTREIASEIYDILSVESKEFFLEVGDDFYDDYFSILDDKDRIKNQVELIVDILEKEFEKAIPIEINSEKLEKANNFEQMISIIQKNIENFDFSENIKEKKIFEIDFIKKEDKEYYSIKFTNGNAEISISTDNLFDFKEQFVQVIEKNLKDRKSFYQENYLEKHQNKREENLSSFKENDVKFLEIETKNPIHFNFNNVSGKNQISFKIEAEDNLFLSIKYGFIYNSEDLSYILKNDDYLSLLKRISENSHLKSYKKIEEVKKETEHYKNKLDKIVENTSLKETILGIYGNTIKDVLEDDRKFDSNVFYEVVKENFNRNYNNRIRIIKDKENFVMKNLEELGITIDSIPANKKDNEKFFDKVLDLHQKISFDSFFETIEKTKEEKIKADYAYICDEDEQTKEEFVLTETLNDLNFYQRYNEFYNIKSFIINNLIATTLYDEKEKFLNFLNESYDLFLENLEKKVYSNFNDLSNSLNGKVDKKMFLEVFDNFSVEDYKELVDFSKKVNLEIEIPTKKENKFEKDNEKII